MHLPLLPLSIALSPMTYLADECVLLLLAIQYLSPYRHEQVVALAQGRVVWL